MHLKIQVDLNPFNFTAIYASPNFGTRKLFWDNLAELAKHINLPWLVIGDFNDIANPSETIGGR